MKTAPRQQKVVIDFDDDGNPKIDCTGFVGKECIAATADLEKALGVSGGDVKKPEFAKREQTRQQQGN